MEKIKEDWRKKPRNRPHKIPQAMALTKSAVDNLTVVLEKMSNKQRKLFVSLSKGYDYLEACLDADFRHPFGIIKIVYDKKRKPVEIDKVTFDNVHTLDNASYQRLLNVCTSDVRLYMAEFKPEDFLVDVRKLFKMIAPDSLNVLAQIQSDKRAKDADRIAAAKDLLDRAGYQPDKAPKSPMMPVQVNIVMDRKALPEDVSVVSYTGEKKKDDVSEA